jgi:cohesin domain-containing protein
VMLLTPHIVRAPEITESDLKPLYIGTQNSLGIGGPPPLIAGPEPADNQPGVGQPPPAPGPPILTPPPGTSPVPGFVVTPQPPPPAPAPPPQPPAPQQPPPGAGAAATTPPSLPVPTTTSSPNPTDVPQTTAGIGQAQVLITPPATPFRVGGGPYNVPITITNATRISGITLALTYDPTLLRPRTVTEGGFMRTGGYNATFNNQIGNGRVDIVIIRAADSTGATGTGLLGAVMFDAIAAGTTTLGISGTATGPGGTAMGLQFRPVTVTIQP